MQTTRESSSKHSESDSEIGKDSTDKVIRSTVVSYSIPITDISRPDHDRYLSVEEAPTIYGKHNSCALKSTLFVRFRLDVYEVDAVTQVITFSLKLFFKWVEPITPEVADRAEHNTHKQQAIYEDIEASQLEWTPTFFFKNLMEKTDIAEHYSICRASGTVIGVFEYVLKIREILELQRFPFDRQLLKLDVYCKCPLQQWMVDPDAPEPPFVLQEATCAGFYNPMWKLERYESHLFNSVNMHHQLSIRLFASRNPIFYVVNFGLVNFLIIVLSMTTTAVPNQLFAERASITMTLLLTSIAFKFVITSYVPPTKYMTLLDQYMIIGLFVLGAVTFENYLVSFEPRDEAAKVDQVVCSLIFTSWALFHVFIFVAARNKWLLKDWATVVKEDDMDQTFSVGSPMKQQPHPQQSIKMRKQVSGQHWKRTPDASPIAHMV